MARLQILELPEGSSDDRPPFVLVVDEWEVDSLDTHTMLGEYWDSFGEKIGARGVLFVDRKIDLPANDTTAYLGDSRLPPDTHYETIVGGRPVEWTPVSDGQRLADERTDIARDMDRLAHRRDELADALGIDRDSNWDDIRNTAARLRAEAERLQAGEEPYSDESITPTPAQWIWHWNRATPENRLDKAGQILDGMARSNRCFLHDHEAEIQTLRTELAEARSWARHGYEIGQKYCGWTDHGVAPDWLTQGWPNSFNSCAHLKRAAELDEAISRVRDLHQPVDYRGQTICRECSAYAESSTDNAPVAYDQCATLRALVADQPAPDA